MFDFNYWFGVHSNSIHALNTLSRYEIAIIGRYFKILLDMPRGPVALFFGKRLFVDIISCMVKNISIEL